MRLPKQAIEEYRKIYERTNGKSLDYEKAYLMASELLKLYRVVYLPVDKPNRSDYEADL